MIQGIGTDIIEVERIRQALASHGPHFVQKLFTEKEQAHCQKHRTPAQPYAGRFAAKEAIAKCLGCGFGKQLAWLDIEILNNAQGKPIVTLAPSVAHAFNNPTIELSIAHCRAYATATAIRSL